MSLLCLQRIQNKTAELSWDELDLLIMEELLTSLQSGPVTSALKHLPTQRVYTHTIYYHNKQKVNSEEIIINSICYLLDLSKTFLFLHGIDNFRYDESKSYQMEWHQTKVQLAYNTNKCSLVGDMETPTGNHQLHSTLN